MHRSRLPNGYRTNEQTEPGMHMRPLRPEKSLTRPLFSNLNEPKLPLDGGEYWGIVFRS